MAVDRPALFLFGRPDPVGPAPWEVALNPLLLCCGGLNGMHLQLGDEIDILEAQCAEIRRQNVSIKLELSRLKTENDELRASNSDLIETRQALEEKARAPVPRAAPVWGARSVIGAQSGQYSQHPLSLSVS